MQQIIKSEKEGHVPQESSDVRNQLVITFWGPSEMAPLSKCAIERKGESAMRTINMMAVESVQPSI